LENHNYKKSVFFFEMLINDIEKESPFFFSRLTKTLEQKNPGSSKEIVRFRYPFNRNG